jgi:polar amino acid transport system ATP-binding protein
MNSTSVVFEQVVKTYGGAPVLNGIDAIVEHGSTVVLCGSSGSGKSTLIRLVNRLEPISGGKIYVNGQDIHDRLININLLRSNIGFVSQSFNLFQHLSALENVAIALRRVRGMCKSDAFDKASMQLKRLGLGGLSDRYASQLSGGQQQRVAIARTLAMEPRIVLFDEPTSALDPEMVNEVLNSIRTLAEEGMTIMCVTHEMKFARQAADRIWFLEKGVLLQNLPCDQFFGDNSNDRVRRFLSSSSH